MSSTESQSRTDDAVDAVDAACAVDEEAAVLPLELPSDHSAVPERGS